MNKDIIIEVDDTENLSVVNAYIQLANAILK